MLWTNFKNKKKNILSLLGLWKDNSKTHQNTNYTLLNTITGFETPNHHYFLV